MRREPVKRWKSLDDIYNIGSLIYWKTYKFCKHSGTCFQIEIWTQYMPSRANWKVSLMTYYFGFAWTGILSSCGHGRITVCVLLTDATSSMQGRRGEQSLRGKLLGRECQKITERVWHILNALSCTELMPGVRVNGEFKSTKPSISTSPQAFQNVSMSPPWVEHKSGT